MKNINSLLQKNPELALQQMVSSFGGLVYTVVRGILEKSPADEIEDCVSDTFLYVFNNRQRLDFSEGSIKAYLCTTARHLAFDRLRKQKKEQTVQSALDESFMSEPSAEELVLMKADRNALIDAILALGEPDSKIIIYRYYFQLKSVEISELLGIKTNTVDKRAGRALKKLSLTLRKGDTYESSY